MEEVTPAGAGLSPRTVGTRFPRTRGDVPGHHSEKTLLAIAPQVRGCPDVPIQLRAMEQGCPAGAGLPHS